MAPESGHEGEEAKKGASSSLVNEEPASGHQSAHAGTPADLVAPKCRKDTKASPTQVDLQSAPKFLDPHTLRLRLGQRELEMQALRCAIQDRQDARHHRILQEVAGLPLERGPHSQHKFLQIQVQKLTLELKEQKGRAQLEREHLEEQLLQTQTLLQQREAQLQALHRSCLVQLAHSSWVGRMLRSSTGSVEVVTAETLVDPSDSSENDEASPAQEGFRLEDVDWNTVAHRYPNLLASIKSNSDYRHPPRPRTPPWPPVDSLPDACGPESCGRQHCLKSVEWGSLPFVGPDNSRGADSDSSSWRLDERFGVQKVTGHPPRSPGHISFQHMVSPARTFSRDSNAEPEGPPEPGISPDSCETHSDQPGKAAGAEHGTSVHPRSKTASCLKVVAVSLSKGFVRILNQSAEETANLGGFTLQQLAGGFPTCTYRFPPHTLLEPQHHLTVRPTHREPARPHPLPVPLTRAWHCPQVWGEGPGCTKKQLPSSVGREPVHSHPSPSFVVTLLLSPEGEVLSEYQAPHCPIPALRIFEDPDFSIDRFPLSEARPGAHAPQQRRPRRLLRKGHRREAGAQSWRPRTQAPSTGLATSRLISPQEVPTPPEHVEKDDARELLPAISGETQGTWREGPWQGEAGPHPPSLSHTEDRLSLMVYQSEMKPTVQVCQKSVDRGCPMVALSVQSRAKSGSCLPGCPPITVDMCRRV